MKLLNIVFSGAVTAILTNPIWVVKIRMFTTHPKDPTAYRGLWRTSPLPYDCEIMRILIETDDLPAV